MASTGVSAAAETAPPHKARDPAPAKATRSLINEQEHYRMNDHTDARAALVAGLRALADDIERSDAPLPTHAPRAQWLIFGDEGQKETVTHVVRSIGGKWEKLKTQSGDLFDFTKDYGAGVHAQVVVDRPVVCERRVVATEVVTIPAQEARPERTETREVVEWDCQPILSEASA